MSTKNKGRASQIESTRTDRVSPAKRSEMMSRVKGKNTKPELLVRAHLHLAGFRFRLHRKDLPGKPDIVLPGLRTVVFVHGCFWHQHPGCSRSALPKQNADFWKKKMQGNIDRDARDQEMLTEAGWNVEVLWECRLQSDIPLLVEKLTARRQALGSTKKEIAHS